ncbi:MAG: GTPase [Candidatus Nanoarchaeia archaeon]
MRVRYSFSSRRTRKLKNIRKQREKFPSLVLKIVANSDIIIEVLDARFIKETRNLELEEEITRQGKKIIYVLNKSDIIKKLNKKDMPNLKPHVVVSCKLRKGIKELRSKIKELSKKIKNPVGERITIGVIGYPNTGKSSLINLLIGKSSAGTGSDAGFTKGIQKLKLTSEIFLLDSPGVIPKKEYSSIKSKLIAGHTKVGARSYSQVKEPEIVIATLMQEYKDVIEKHYKIQAKGDSEILLEKLGKKWNYFKKGGVVNLDKTARRILKDWQSGEIKV